jgi:proteasome lid subunit RPN8/RPN11
MDNALMECLDTQAREYLRSGGSDERGGLISKDFKFYPFENVADDPVREIRMGEEGFITMMRLQSDRNLLAWAHSHLGDPTPSITDIVMHDMPVNMIIYSVRDDTFKEYTPDQIQVAAEGLRKGRNQQ